MPEKRILLTGVNGQVGHALLPQLSHYQLFALSRQELDISNPDAIRRVVREIKPDLIINPAAYTAVDLAEGEPELAFAINATAPKILAEEAAKLGAAIIHFSTDYVYDGTKVTPYVETDAANPAGVYAKSKFAGEEAISAVGLPHIVLRTSWVYGPHGKNFLKTILRLASERENLRIVADQFGAPSNTIDISHAVIELLEKWQPDQQNQMGIYHLTNQESTSWHGFSCEIVSAYQALADVRGWPALKTSIDNIAAINTSEYPTPAERPKNSRLDNSKLKKTFNIELPTWQNGLEKVLKVLPNSA